MKIINIINAYNATEKLAGKKEFSVKDQWEIYQIRKFLRQKAEFYDERRDVLTEKYADKADENGKVYGKDADDFFKDCNELDNLDVDMSDYEKIQIRLVNGIDFKMIEQLEDFIEFLPPEE